MQAVCGGEAVLEAAVVILPVQQGAVVGHCFAQLAAFGIVEDVDDFFRAGAGVAPEHLFGQVEEIVGDRHAFVGVAYEVSVGVVQVRGRRKRSGSIVPAVGLGGGGSGIGYFLQAVVAGVIREGQLVSRAVAPAALSCGFVFARALQCGDVSTKVVLQVFVVSAVVVHHVAVAQSFVGGSGHAAQKIVPKYVRLSFAAAHAPDGLGDVAVFLPS